MVAKLSSALVSITSEDKPETVREFAEKFHVVEKVSISHSDYSLSYDFLVTLFESRNGANLMHVDFQAAGEGGNESNAFSVILKDRGEYDVLRAAIDYWKELEAFLSSNAEKWKSERVRLPFSTFFHPDESETDTHSEPRMAMELPLPFVPKIVRLSKAEAVTREEIEDLFIDISQTLHAYGQRRTTLLDALDADERAAAEKSSAKQSSPEHETKHVP